MTFIIFARILTNTFLPPSGMAVPSKLEILSGKSRIIFLHGNPPTLCFMNNCARGLENFYSYFLLIGIFSLLKKKQKARNRAFCFFFHIIVENTRIGQPCLNKNNLALFKLCPQKLWDRFSVYFSAKKHSCYFPA